MPDHVHLVSAPNYDANGPVSIAEIMPATGAAAAHRLIGDLGEKERFGRRVSWFWKDTGEAAA
jgi:hypothetical protein